MSTYGEERLHDLIKRLLKNLDSTWGPRRWSTTDRDQAFSATISDNTIVVACKNDDGKEPFQLLVLDSKGRLVDSIETGFTWYEDDEYSTPEPWNAELEQLHERVRRQAGNIDGVLDEIFTQLDADDEPPF